MSAKGWRKSLGISRYICDGIRTLTTSQRVVETVAFGAQESLVVVAGFEVARGIVAGEGGKEVSDDLVQSPPPIHRVEGEIGMVVQLVGVCLLEVLVQEALRVRRGEGAQGAAHQVALAVVGAERVPSPGEQLLSSSSTAALFHFEGAFGATTPVCKRVRTRTFRNTPIRGRP